MTKAGEQPTITQAPDEDWFEEIISDSIDMDWRPRDAARAIVRRWGERWTDVATSLPSQDETAWLVDFPESGDKYRDGKRVGPATPMQWLSMAGGRTTDANEAMRFCRKADAEGMIAWIDKGPFAFAQCNAIATEHKWIGGPTTSLAAQDGLVEALEIIAVGEGCMNGIREELSADALRKIARKALAAIKGDKS